MLRPYPTATLLRWGSPGPEPPRGGTVGPEVRVGARRREPGREDPAVCILRMGHGTWGAWVQAWTATTTREGPGD